jgi:competence protein ComEA
MRRTFLRRSAVFPVVPVIVTVVLLVGPNSAHAQSVKPRTPAASQPAAPGAPPAVKPAAIVNLNTATLVELEALPGVGAKTAARIVDYRQKKGPFKKIEELMNVQGIGEKSFLKLKPQITVAGNAPAPHGQ